MSKRPRQQVHGASIAAPEEAFAESESPAPPAVQVRTVGPVWFDRAWSGLRVLIGAGAVVGTSVAVAASAYHYAMTSPRFALKSVEVSGGHRFSSSDFAQWGGVALGTNVFGIDTQALEARLLKNPWLRQVRVVRRLPGTLEVSVTERDARAAALIGGHLYLVGSDGDPFKEIESKDPSDLPVITGLQAENFQRDRARERERALLALDVLGQYERLGMSRSYVAEEIHLGDGGLVSLTVGKDPIVIHLGTGSFRQRLLMAERVVEQTRKGGHLPGVVFADNQAHPERVVVRMR